LEHNTPRIFAQGIAMASRNTYRKRESFQQSVPQVLLLGTVCSIVFFGLIRFGPLRYELLERYCTNHPVAIACIGLFFTGLVTLLTKWVFATRQSNFLSSSAGLLHRFVGEGDSVEQAQRARWLIAHWQSAPSHIQNNWFSQRLTSALDLQISRGKRHQLESDLDSLANAEADRQHESYGLLRIINWAMPMLGFLGTVLGISQTLGQLDTELLATQQQAAMNELTAGLYVAFDTTATALILTVVLMFLQFGVSRLELQLINTIDTTIKRDLVPFLGADPYDAQSTLLAPVREMTASLLTGVKQLVHDQSRLWQSSIEESQQQWASWTAKAADSMQSEIGESIRDALTDHTSQLRQIQDDAHAHLDTRWQQWQTTLSEQARSLQSQQKEIAQHGTTLLSVLESTEELVRSTTDLRKLEETIQDSVSRLENLGRLEETTAILTEAVAFLGTTMERAGAMRGTPLKPRPSSSSRASDKAQRQQPATQSPKRDSPLPFPNQDSPTQESSNHNSRRKAA
jgi:biopolymer transport protein ExbB/TolQ